MRTSAYRHAGCWSSVDAVAGCCDPRGCDQFFTPGFAPRAAGPLPHAWARPHRPAHGRLPRRPRSPRCERARDRRRRRGDPARAPATRRGPDDQTSSSGTPTEHEATRLMREAGSSSTASSAATRTTSGCSPRPPTTPGARSSATRHASRSRGPSSPRRTSACGLRSGTSAVHPPAVGDARRPPSTRTPSDLQPPQSGLAGRGPRTLRRVTDMEPTEHDTD
jgi:hypothetical protein